jgi:hypothetical protein
LCDWEFGHYCSIFLEEWTGNWNKHTYWISRYWLWPFPLEIDNVFRLLYSKLKRINKYWMYVGNDCLRFWGENRGQGFQKIKTNVHFLSTFSKRRPE